MTELEMMRMAILGRQHKISKCFTSESERLEYIVSLMNQPQWQIKRIYERTECIIEFNLFYTVYCVDLESIA